MIQIPAICGEKDNNHCHYTLEQFSYISFTPEGIQVKGKHDKPLYYIGYIRSSEVSRIQVNLGSMLSIIPRRVMQYLGIPIHRFSATQTTIYNFNANGTYPMGKIKLRCKIGGMRSEVTYYVIDANTSYNLLLGRPWVHCNSIVPSTLHQVIKYVDEEEK